MITVTANTSAYSTLFKGWQVKQLGTKPTDDMLATVHALGLRPGKQALANAMALRPEGVSGAQIVMATGAPQLNRMRGLIASGVVKRDMGAPANVQGHTVYKLNLTPKGETAINRAKVAADKAALNGGETVKPKAKKAKGAATAKRARKAKVTAPEAVAEAPAVATEVPAPQGDGADQGNT